MAKSRSAGPSGAARKTASAEPDDLLRTKRSTESAGRSIVRAACKSSAPLSGPYLSRTERTPAVDRQASDDRESRQPEVPTCPPRRQPPPFAYPTPTQSSSATAWQEGSKYPRSERTKAGLRPSLNAHGIHSKVSPLDDEDKAKLLKGVSRRVHGVFASAMNRKPVPWSRREQRDLMHLLEVDGSILSYEAVPEKVEYVLDGKECKHLPAFRVHTRLGDAILDAFPGSAEVSEARARKIAALTEIYADRGIPYRAFTSSQITVEPRFGNAKWLLRQHAYIPDGAETLLLMKALSKRGSSTVAELRAALPGLPNLHGVLGAMAIRGLVSVDLSASVPTAMRVSLRAEAAR